MEIKVLEKGRNVFKIMKASDEIMNANDEILGLLEAVPNEWLITELERRGLIGTKQHTKQGGMTMLAELEQASQEIIKFMNENCSPHDMILIRQGRVELLSGQRGFPTEITD